MKRFFFIPLTLLSGVLSLAFVSLSSSPVSAASEYDNTIHTTDNLTITSYGNNQTYDITETWLSDIENGSHQYCNVDQINSFKSRKYLSVTKLSESDGSFRTIAVNWQDQSDLEMEGRFFTNDPNTQYEHRVLQLWHKNGSQGNGRGMYIQYNHGNMALTCDNHNNYFTRNIATNWTSETYWYADSYLFLNTFPVVYPEGYEGLEPPTTTEGVTKFDYFVTDKKITMQNKTPELRGDETCRWYVNTNPAETYQEGDVTNDKIISRSCTEQPSYTFTDYGYYEVSLSVTYPFGLDGVSEQDTWDAYKTVHIDGTTFSGAADIHGDAPLQDPLYEDCDFADIGCHLRNTVVSIVEGFKALFFPNTDSMKNMFDDMNEFFNEKLGFLYQSIASVVGIFTMMIDRAANPTSVLTPDGTYFGETVSFDINSARSVIGDTAYDLIFVAIRSITAVGIIFGLYRTYIGFISERRD